MKIAKRLAGVMLIATMGISLIGCSGKNSATQVKEADEQKEDKAAAKKNLIKNGDFSDGTNRYGTYEFDGISMMKVNEAGELQVDISDVGSVSHGVQIFYDGFKLLKDAVYQFSCDVHGTIDRDIELRFQINGGDYHAYYMDSIPVTGDSTHYTVEFTMQEDSDPAPRLCFNMGLTDSMKAKGKPDKHSVMLDNLELVIKDDSNATKIDTGVEAPKVKINQLGYGREANKVAVFTDLEAGDDTFSVIDAATGKSVYDGQIGDERKNLYAKEQNRTGDFSKLTSDGRYKVVTSKGEESYEFEIGENPYRDDFTDVANMLYLQRCGQELSQEEAGEFAHPVCHNTKATIYGTDKKIDVTGGWHDAGDYGRYVVPGAKTVADLLLAYEINPSAFDSGTISALGEAQYELNWMLKMQDKDSGGVYHKVTCRTFPETCMPQDETDELVVSPISKTATADFAAVMAMASRVYGANGDKDLADQYIKAAERAFKYYLDHINDSPFTNPKDIVTGEYGDSFSRDEYLWAATELYKTTSKPEYVDHISKAFKDTADNYQNKLTGFGWMDVSGYGAYAALTTESLKTSNASLCADISKAFFAGVDEIIKTSKENPYMSARYEKYEWGSNMGIANNGMQLVLANKLKEDKEYDFYAEAQLNYLLGVNPNGYSYVTGKGSVYPQHPHHRPSQVVGKAVPGMLVGGPNNALEDPYAKAVLATVAPAKCYVDNEQSYSCNEICIYWNSPLIFLMAAK